MTTDDRIRAAAIRLFVSKGTTQVTISELAAEAGVARGTLYRNVGSIDTLFSRVINELSAELHQRIAATFDGIDDSAARLAIGIRLWVRYAHENPLMGRFAVKFGLSEESLRTWMVGPPQHDVAAGVDAGRYELAGITAESVAALVQGATISAMWMVLEGHQTWRDAGTATAALALRALGIPADEALDVASRPLPTLAEA